MNGSKLQKRKCQWPEERGGCKQYFLTNSKQKKYCSYHKRLAYTIQSEEKYKKAKIMLPNTFCSICETWHYDENADPKIQRNFCMFCKKKIEAEDSALVDTETYKITCKIVCENGEKYEKEAYLPVEEI